MISLLTIASIALLTACNPDGAAQLAHAGTSQPLNDTVKVKNLEPNQEITEEVPTFLRIGAADQVTAIKVLANGTEIGTAELDETAKEKAWRFEHSFLQLGDQDLTFQAFAEGNSQPIGAETVRVRVIPKAPGAPSRYFNAYILKAVAHLTKNWGLLGYDITKQLTHPINFNNQGTLKPTGGGLTMCVSGVLETIVTAFELYARETGDKSVYSFLPFDSWNTLRNTNIKAHIWVNPKLNSSGTGDAIAKFGMGENVRFRDLKPGGFININRTTGTGHAVVFLSFIDKKGRDVPSYNDTVVGFRYFGAQGRRIKGKGGFSYRHAFFSKYGCPEVPYQRDCNVILSDSQKMLNVGMMYMPKEWKKKSSFEIEQEIARVTPSEEGEEQPFDPAQFDGVTTDD